MLPFGCLIQVGAPYLNLLGIIIVINEEFLNLGIQNHINVIPIVAFSQCIYLPLHTFSITIFWYEHITLLEEY